MSSAFSVDMLLFNSSTHTFQIYTLANVANLQMYAL